MYTPFGWTPSVGCADIPLGEGEQAYEFLELFPGKELGRERTKRLPLKREAYGGV